MKLKSIDIILEWSKQVTALATGTVVLSATFMKDLFGAQTAWQGAILVSWLAMAFSASIGVVYLGVLISSVSEAKVEADIDVYEKSWIAVIQVSLFFIGLLAFVAFSWKNVGSGPHDPPGMECSKCACSAFQRGQDGRDGKDGQPGRDGRDGRDGVPGRDGAVGPRGSAGQGRAPCCCDQCKTAGEVKVR